MNKRHYEHTLPNIRGSLSNTYTAFSCNIKKDFDKKEGIVECDLCVTSVVVSPYNLLIKSKMWLERFFLGNFL